jgi:hypothetical protein
MKVETLWIDKITPYSGNAKEHPDWQVDQIVKSIKQFGFNDPIAVDEAGVIIEGHGRYMAAVKMGMTEIPAIVLELLSEQKKKAYILAHNKLTMNTGFDLSLLDAELASITDIDMSDFGFEFVELTEEYGESFSLPDGDKEPFQQITFTLADNQAEEVKAALSLAKKDNNVETWGNENSNGNAIYRIVKEWAEQKI